VDDADDPQLVKARDALLEAILDQAPYRPWPALLARFGDPAVRAALMAAYELGIAVGESQAEADAEGTS
jgi:hypothetical protein